MKTAKTLMDLVLDDVQTGGDFGFVAFLAYFINDQLSRILFEIKEEYSEKALYQRNSLLQQIDKEIDRATKHFNKVSKGNEYEVADRLVKLEDYFLPHIDAIYLVIEKEFAQFGYNQEEITFYSKLFLMMFLARCSGMLVEKFHRLTNKFRVTTQKLMQQDDLNVVFLLCEQILDNQIGRENVNQLCNHSEQFKTVFQNLFMRFQNKLFLGELMK